MSGRIAGLWRFTEKGRPGEEIPEAVFIENKAWKGTVSPTEGSGR